MGPSCLPTSFRLIPNRRETAMIKTTDVFILGKHYIVDFSVCLPEPDVGIMNYWVEIEKVRDSKMEILKYDEDLDRTIVEILQENIDDYIGQ